MRLPPFQYLEPGNVGEALSMLSSHRGTAKILAGGTDLLNRLKWRLVEPAFLLNIGKIEGLDGIVAGDTEIEIGPNTRLSKVAASPAVLRRIRAIAEAASQVASPAIAKMATLGGNILQNTRCMYYNQSGLVLSGLERCHKRGGSVCLAVKGSKRCFSVYQGDMAPALIAFDARCVLEKKGSSRTLPLKELFTGNGASPLAVEADEMLTKIIIPNPRGASGSAYRKLRLRGSTDYPLASVAAFVSAPDGQKVTPCRLVIGAAGSAPRVVDGVSCEADLGRVAEKASEIAEGVDNLQMPGAYRKKMFRVLAKRAIQAAIDGIKEGE